MPPWLIHGAAIAGRVLAGAFGFLCFYVAFFMYENEEGQWQNRIENLWISFDDRARITGSRSIAFFNRTADLNKRFFKGIFGEKLLSFRSVTGSVIVSFAVSLATSAILAMASRYFRELAEGPVGPIGSFVLSVLLLMPTTVPFIFKRPWLHVLLTIPAFLIAISFPFFSMKLDDINQDISPFIACYVLTVILSIFSDVIAIAIVRKQLSSISTSFTLPSIFGSIFILVVTLVALVGVPFFAGLVAVRTLGMNVHAPMVQSLANLLALNESTAYCVLLPLISIGVVVIIKMWWPSVARFIYPFSRFRFISNRKLLIGLGLLSFTIAFNLEKVGVKEILKLLS